MVNEKEYLSAMAEKDGRSQLVERHRSTVPVQLYVNVHGT